MSYLESPDPILAIFGAITLVVLGVKWGITVRPALFRRGIAPALTALAWGFVLVLGLFYAVAIGHFLWWCARFIW